ncbi:response regulator [Paenibacillaceae bacterium]|nr:response regulator [Paenibacillaceae bacterium]
MHRTMGYPLLCICRRGMGSMYNVLLADDERLDLDGLKRLIPWQQLNLQVASAVNSGFAALEYLREHEVDILVTDVRMPRMSGLELARTALQLYPHLKIVFISGFEDFHYAKSALEMGASNYILKPMDNQEFIRTMQAVAGELDGVRARKSKDATFAQSLPYFRNELMRDWLEGRLDPVQLDVQMKELDMGCCSGPYAVAIIEIDDISWKLNAYRQDERIAMIKRQLDYLYVYCQPLAIGLPCRLSSHRIGIVASGSVDRSIFVDMLRLVQEQFLLTVTVGLGGPAAAAEGVAAAYEQAEQALSAKMLCGKGRLLTPSDIHVETAAEARDMDAILANLFQAAVDYELIKVDDCLTELFRFGARLGSKMTVYNFSIHIMTKLNTHLGELNEDLYSMLGLEYTNLEVLYQFETIGDIHAWFRRKLFEVSEMIYMKKQRKSRRLITEVVQYIDQRLGQDLTLRDVADHFFFSPNHLGFLFREEMGESFSDFAIRRRLETAKTYLEDPKLKIYEVAKLAGYQNIAYFSRQFKSLYGMTPGEYRNAKSC